MTDKNSDVTAVVLTIGEDSVQRAIESINNQTLKVKQVIQVENITPFHKAMNYGVSKVNTEFFIQVDADMILDMNCIESLRSCFHDNVGIVIGHLRDTLMGRVVGVKMFRTRCFDNVKFTDSISPDTDFYDESEKNNWQTIYALNYDDNNTWHTYGVHAPDYDFQYTFNKYLLIGRRCIYRKSYIGLYWHYSRIITSSHPMAIIAQIALLNGALSSYKNDNLKKDFIPEKSVILEDLFKNSKDTEKYFNKIDSTLSKSFKLIFERFFEIGLSLRELKRFTSFTKLLQNLNLDDDKISFIACMALCNGLLSNSSYHFNKERYYQELKTIFTNIERSWKVKKYL